MRKGLGLVSGIIGLALLIAAGWILAGQQAAKPDTTALVTKPAPEGSLSLITEPDAGMAPELNLINGAQKSIDLIMYELEDPQVEQALVSAQARGVSVRVLLNQGYYGEQTKANEPAYDFLQTDHVPVKWTPSYFALTHQKTLIVDGRTASVMTFNFTPQYYASSRDFAVNDTDPSDVQAIEATFSSDWNSTKSAAASGDDLVWSPGSETTTLNLIGSAKHSLDIYNEEMADTKVVTALEQAAARGVNVEITMTYSSEWKYNFQKLKASGAHIHTYAASASRYIHAKMIVADDSRAFLGSENFSTNSLTKNRELGLILQDPSIIQSLQTTFVSDYQAAAVF